MCTEDQHNVTDVIKQAPQSLSCDLPHKPGKLNDDGLLTKLFYGEPLTHDEIADIFGVSRVAVTNRVNKLGLLRKLYNSKEYEERFGEELLNKIQIVMNQISADKIQSASLSQLGVLLGILYDKRNQHEKRGQPEVSYVGVLHKFDPQSIAQIREVIQTETAKRLEESRKVTIQQIRKDAAELPSSQLQPNLLDEEEGMD